MRTLLLTVVLAVMLTTSAAAYDYGYIGLFADEARTSWCLESPAYVQFDMYVFCLPSDNGVRAVEFSIGMPPSYVVVANTPGPTVSVTLGDYLNGISYSLYLCVSEWFLLDTYSILPTADGQAAIWLKGHGETGEISIASCLTGYPIEQALAYTSVFVNYPPGSPECSGVGTEESSWGAIKEMLR
jgi:hypothetical protein